MTASSAFQFPANCLRFACRAAAGLRRHVKGGAPGRAQWRHLGTHQKRLRPGFPARVAVNQNFKSARCANTAAISPVRQPRLPVAPRSFSSNTTSLTGSIQFKEGTTMARTRKDTKLTIFSFENLRIPATDDGVDIEFHLAESVRRLVAVLTSLLKASKSLRTKAMGVMRIGEDRASGVIDVPQAGVPGLIGAIESVSITIKAGFDDVTRRYQEAMRTNQAIRRTAFDKQIIKLNALAWGA